MVDGEQAVHDSTATPSARSQRRSLRMFSGARWPAARERSVADGSRDSGRGQEAVAHGATASRQRRAGASLPTEGGEAWGASAPRASACGGASRPIPPCQEPVAMRNRLLAQVLGGPRGIAGSWRRSRFGHAVPCLTPPGAARSGRWTVREGWRSRPRIRADARNASEEPGSVGELPGASFPGASGSWEGGSPASCRWAPK